MKQTLGYIRQADRDFSLLAHDDQVAVGLSGGKDSLLLLKALSLYRLFSHKDYALGAFTVDPGFGFDPAPLTEYCRALQVPFHFLPGAVAEKAAGEVAEGKAPCHLCARNRRGILYKHAAALGYHKVALGHHRDDVLETFLLGLFYEGRLHALPPKSFLSRRDITVIRPLLYLPERHIASAVRRLQLPVQTSPCPFDGHTQRSEMKALIQELSRRYPQADDMMFAALRNRGGYRLWPGEGEPLGPENRP